nr:putative reverse transcriptase domain-containing protein [Tanacetum cinerariifolium]
MRQRRWIELFSGYDCEIHYHPGKANIVADALSRKERVKPRRARAMSMTIHTSIKARILEAQSEAPKVKAKHQKPSGLLQQPEIPEWKWENIIMDFINKLPRTRSGHDSIWVIVDRLTKSTHFLAVREDFKTENLASLYINEIIARHDVPVSIIYDHDSYFTSRFWQSLQRALGTRLDFNTTYHLKTDGQKFSYNNNYHSSVKCALFEALYGRRCRTPIAWEKAGESKLIGPEIKSYADNRQRPLEFIVSDKVLLKVSPKKGMVRFGLESNVMRECCFVVERDAWIRGVSGFGIGASEFTLSSLDVLQGFSFFLQIGITLILATLKGLDVGLLGDVIGEDDYDDDG